MFEGDKLSDRYRRELKKEILKTIETLNFTILNAEKVRSRSGFNKYEVKYLNHYVADETMVKDILIETMVVYKPYPVDDHPVSNYITKYLDKEKRFDLIAQYALEPFMMKVQTINRTFVDKVFALCDYHLQENYSRHSRHLYDLHQIWHSEYFDVKEINSMMASVIEDRQRYGKNNLSCQVGQKPVEILKEIIAEDVYKEDYNKVTIQFVYDDITYLKTIDTIKKIIEANIIPNIIIS